MLKYFLAAAALVLAGVPAAVGLAGNDSFTRDVPVRVPQQAQLVTPTPSTTSDDGTADQGPGDDATEAGDDQGEDNADDQGEDAPGDNATETGDDNGGDNGGTSGSDDS